MRLEGAVGDAEVADVGQAEGHSRNDGDTEFGYQTLHHGHGSQLGVKSSKQVEGAVGTGDDAGWGESVAPVHTHLADPRDLLHERGAVLAARLKGAEGGPLGDDGGTDENGVLAFFQRAEQLAGGDHVADAPAGQAVGLGERKQGDGVPAAVFE